MRTKLVTSTDPAEFDSDLNAELEGLKGVVSVQFSTAVTNNADGEWDTVYSAVIVYRR